MQNDYLPEDYSNYYPGLLGYLKIHLPDYRSLPGNIPHDIKGNRLRLYLNSIKSNHYEVNFRTDYLEIALHFESSLAQNERLLSVFSSHKEEILASVGVPVQYGL